MCTGGSNPSTSAKQNENVLMRKKTYTTIVDYDNNTNQYFIPLPQEFVNAYDIRDYGTKYKMEVREDGAIVLTPKTNK